MGSPTEAIIQDFITRGLTTDDVYIVLKEMGHAAGMKILKDYSELYIITMYCVFIFVDM